MKELSCGVDLRPDHLSVVKAILNKHVPECEVVAFGSRATWTAKDYSDLDLAILGDSPLSGRRTAALCEAFVESALPFKVDIVEWARIDERFRNIILRDGVTIPTSEKLSY